MEMALEQIEDECAIDHNRISRLFQANFVTVNASCEYYIVEKKYLAGNITPLLDETLHTRRTPRDENFSFRNGIRST